MTEALVCYRAIDPRWSFVPLSGEGAALNGGRWNAPGSPALYLALDEITAVHEYNQGLGFHPLTLARYHLTGATLANLCDEDERKTLNVNKDVLQTPWLEALSSGQEPETHKVAKRLAADFDGLMYPSVVTSTGRCLVLWRWNQDKGAQVRVEDLDGRLPKDQKSWT
ncbi:MAG: RES domain-containing protein [Pseudomonadota bacterium]